MKVGMMTTIAIMNDYTLLIMIQKQQEFIAKIMRYEMTDKERIIIDGVDVSECEEFYRACVNTQEPEVICKKYKFCSENSNFYFKSLARKTQECENLKEDYKELEQRHDEAFKDFERLKQECEELKSESFTREELITLQEKDIDRYRKALEEIEKICKFNLYQSIVRQSVDSSMSCLNKIRDIISKAKGG